MNDNEEEIKREVQGISSQTQDPTASQCCEVESNLGVYVQGVLETPEQDVQPIKWKEVKE